MTVIAAVTTGNAVHLAADTGSVMDRIYYNRQKIFTLKTESGHEVAFGFAGNGAIGALVRANLVLPDPPTDVEDLVRWATEISIEICAICKAAEPAPVDSDGWLDGSGLMAYDGGVWLLAQQDARLIATEYTAIGCGADLALGVLHARPDMNPRDVLELAIDTACRFDPNCNVDEDGMQYVVNLSTRPAWPAT